MYRSYAVFESESVSAYYCVFHSYVAVAFGYDVAYEDVAFASYAEAVHAESAYGA